ncbi:MAG: signal recognition particle-docking protein FtsY [Lachnospiraceae bacterium]|nr:signal recognition particle-docking protein FtsY [Lachnospiraceae bacterium]
MGGEEVKKEGFFARLKEGLAKTRNNIVRGIDNVFSGFSEIDDDFYEELEEILVMGDIGVNATTQILDRLKAQVKEQHIKKPADCKQFLMQSIKEQMQVGENAYDFEQEQSIVMIIGVNGVGKTTSVGKLAGKYKAAGRRVLIAAADTFRAAAGDQLAEWAKRADVPMIGGKEGADPASVVYDAVSAAKARGVDVLLIDTAGRLHNKKNLMEELRKMDRIIDREFPNAHRENFIVLDGTTGQNALVQAREFGDVADLTGIILTKMDGTAKGGIAVAIQSELQVPVKYIGVGEKIEDLQRFDPGDFVDALFDVEPEMKEEALGDTENVTEADREAEKAGLSQMQPEPQTGSEPEQQTGSEPEPQTGSEPEQQTESEPEQQTGSQPEPKDRTRDTIQESGWTMPAWALESIAEEEAARQTESNLTESGTGSAEEPVEEKKEKVSFWKRLWS